MAMLLPCLRSRGELAIRPLAPAGVLQARCRGYALHSARAARYSASRDPILAHQASPPTASARLVAVEPLGPGSDSLARTGGDVTQPADHDAAKLVKKPDAELQQVLDTIAASSHSSESQARHDRAMPDGSVVVVTSFQGKAPHTQTFPPPPPAPPAVDPPPPPA